MSLPATPLLWRSAVRTQSHRTRPSTRSVCTPACLQHTRPHVDRAAQVLQPNTHPTASAAAPRVAGGGRSLQRWPSCGYAVVVSPDSVPRSALPSDASSLRSAAASALSTTRPPPPTPPAAGRLGAELQSERVLAVQTHIGTRHPPAALLASLPTTSCTSTRLSSADALRLRCPARTSAARTLSGGSAAHHTHTRPHTVTPHHQRAPLCCSPLCTPAR